MAQQKVSAANAKATYDAKPMINLQHTTATYDLCVFATLLDLFKAVYCTKKEKDMNIV